jgi:hypothetical protein
MELSAFDAKKNRCTLSNAVSFGQQSASRLGVEKHAFSMF